jgi:DNA-binding transcriptional LysR family regulator
MELRHLRYFVTTAEELHFTRAAARLHIGQPPLSQQIRDLETEIGVQLFQRLGRRVELTEAGRSFLKDARAVLELAEHAKLTAQQFARGERGSVRIGFNSSSSFNPFVTEVISQYRVKYPDLNLALSEKATTSLLTELRDGRLDVAFIRPAAGETEGLHTKHLFEERMMIAMPVGHRLAKRSSLSLLAFAQESFVMYPRTNGSALYDAIIAACHNAGFSPRIAQEAPQISSTVNLVAAGIGVTIVPESMSHLQTHRVVYRRISGSAPFATMSLAARCGPVSAAIQSFLMLVDSVLMERGNNVRRPPRVTKTREPDGKSSRDRGPTRVATVV